MFYCWRNRLFLFAVALLVYVGSLWNASRIFSRPVQQLIVERPSLCRTASIFRCEHCIPSPVRSSQIETNIKAVSNESWAFDLHRDERNYGLSDPQCDIAFPGLFEDINTFVQRRRTNIITREELSRVKWPIGTLRVMIYDNELYVIDQTKPHVYGQRFASTLNALHRAIITSPEPLPNAEFAITVDDFADDPKRLIWSYTRTADDDNTWLMPDFGFWSYGEPDTEAELGSWTQVRRRMLEVEEGYSNFSEKIPKAFWRGEIALAKDLRTELLMRTNTKPWADVKQMELRFDAMGHFRRDALPIHEHCKFMFLIHTEGNSYSGRLKYLQNCRSVIFAHTLEWIQPFEYLMVSSGPKQNYVEVARDFSDLNEKVEYYLSHLEEAERIANNSVATFRDRYHTPAAETCYWRKLIRGWREVSFEPEFLEDNYSDSKGRRRWRGTPFETYALRKRIDSEE